MHGTKQHSPHTAGRVIHHARLYDLLGTKMSGGRNTLLDLAAPAAAETVLDVGCGTGTLALAMAARPGVTGVTGIDASPEMIEVARGKARKAGSDADFRVGLIEEIPFPDATFDLVTSSLMLHHLTPELKRAGLAEVRRVLKPGGRFVVMDFARESHSPLGHLLSVFGHGRGPAIADALTEVLAAAGFATVDVLPTRHSNLAFVRAG
jgi:demethylmenaquinone methyltransferase/2-methoxy-6-polyprenyl-1,4-benzoquinol methylase/phosphoethanolamine N-methyltransferase